MTNASTPIVYFKKESKKLLRQVEANNAEALARIQRVLKDPMDIGLKRVQHVIAVEHGFSKWEDLIKTPAVDLQAAIARRRANSPKSSEASIGIRTPLGNLFRGPGGFPTHPHFEALADALDRMSLEEQRQMLDEDARAMGLFDHR